MGKRPYNYTSRTGDNKKYNKTDRVMKNASQSKNRKNYTPSRVNKTNNNNNKNKSNNNFTNNLEQTTRIRIDQDRINDVNTLDTSFLESRLEKSNDKRVKEKLLFEKKRFDFRILKRVIFLIIIILIVAVVILCFNKMINVSSQKDKKNKVFVTEKEEEAIDKNYLFVGDFQTDHFDFKDLDYYYIKNCRDDFTTKDVLDDLKANIYRYNPSIVFIQLGIVDLDKEVSNEEIIENLEKIIAGIKENRPYAKIYIESLYPINKDVSDYDDDIIADRISNDVIKELNKKIKQLCLDKKIKYIDLFKLLSEDNKLNEEFTKDGVNLNDDGYQVILKEIKKIVG